MLSFARVGQDRRIPQDKPAADARPAVAGFKPATIGLALGAGSARGWCHIGIIQELAAQGIVPHVIAGTSMGAAVGGCHAAGRLDELEAFARSLTRRRMFGLMDFSFRGGGLIGGSRLRSHLEAGLGQHRIEQLPIRFAAVATETGSGHEVWLTSGNLGEAIRASYALPGIFEPVRVGGRWLIDGALVNPVPVTVCRALGADMVIAVNVIGESSARVIALPAECEEDAAGARPELQLRRNALLGRPADRAPGIVTVMMDAFNITQDRISRSRLAGDPPDVLIKARLDGIGLFDFHRADELIACGREAARRALPDIAEHLTLSPAVEQPAN